MPRQGTAKDAILAQQAQNTPPAINSPAPAPAPALPVQTPTPSPTPAPPRAEGQWNYGTAENQVLAPAPTPAPTPASPATPKPKTASEAIAQGYKQEIKPVNPVQNAPLTTEIGREAKLGQLPNVQQTPNQIEQEKINTQNLKSASGQQLWSNLDTISKNNPSLLNSRSAYDKAFGYQNKDYGERALVDAYWNAKKNDANGLYSALATGQKLPDGASTTPAFQDALIRHQDVTQFENLNPYLLSKKLGTELLPGTQVYNDLMAKNPQLVTDAQKLASINMQVTARQDTKTNWQDTMSSYLSRSPVMQNPTTVATIMNSDPNIATKTNEVQAVEDKLTDAKDRLKKVQENVTERYKGTGATKQTVNAKALAESQDIIDEITMLEANKASASSALTTLISNAKDNYQMARQDRQDSLDNYYKGFSQLQAMAEMGMKQDDMEYQRQQDSVNRDLQMLQYYTNIDQANAKEARGYEFQTQQDIRNFDQQKELAKMGYQNQAYLSNLGFQQNMAQLGAQQGFTGGQNAVSQQNEMIKAAMSQGMTYQDAVNQVMGSQATQQTTVADFIKGKEGFRDKAYDDFDGHILAPGEKPKGTATIGYGFTTINGKPVQAGDTMDRGTADAELPNQVGYHQTFKDKISVALSPQQEAALTSLEYNGGSGVWNYPAGKKMIELINKGDFAGASKALLDSGMLTTEKKTQAKLPGLVKRRQEEAQLLQQGVQPTQMEGIAGLSPLAKAAYNSKTIPGGEKQKAAIINELSSKGLIDNGEGNLNFFEAKPDAKKDMVSLVQGDNLFKKADEIIQRRVNDGTLSEMFGLGDKYGLILANKLPNALKLPNEIKMGEDFKTLQTILGKELSSYMKDVSGATVADAEVLRLMKQVPTLDEWSSDTFLKSWENYSDNLKDAKNGFITQYGFDDMDKAKSVLLGTKTQQPNQGQALDRDAFTKAIADRINANR